MKIEEAIKWLKAKSYQEFCKEPCKIAIEACEKQIAKELKITESDMIINGEIYYDDYYHCPCCNKCFGTLWYVEDNAKTLKTKCCPDCGQALDWE